MNTITLAGRSAPSKDEVRRKIDALNAEAKDHFWDEGWRRERAAEMTEIIYYGFQHEAILPMLSNVDSVADGDRITVEAVTGLEVFWIANGGQVDQSTIGEEVFELYPDKVGWHVSEMTEKFESNFSRSQRFLVDGAIQAMDAAFNTRFVKLVQQAIPSGNASYISGAGLSLAAVNTALTQVRDESLSDVMSIVGRGTMIDQFMNQLQSNSNFAPETQDSIIKTGVLGSYRGTNVVRLKNFKDRTLKSFVPANELYIVGADASITGFWGGLRQMDWIEEGGDYYHSKGTRRAGMAVLYPERMRRIVDTSISA